MTALKWTAALVALLTFPAHGQTGHDRLGKFYASQFHQFNTTFVEIVNQLDRCLAEMDRFEAGNVLLDPVECPRFDKLRPKAFALMEDLEPVMDSYRVTLNTLSEINYTGDAYDRPGKELEEVVALLKLFKVKFKQANVQTKRVQKLERDLMKELEDLVDILKKFKESPRE